MGGSSAVAVVVVVGVGFVLYCVAFPVSFLVKIKDDGQLDTNRI